MQNTTRQALDHFIGRYFSHMDAHQAQDSHYAAPGPKEAQARINALKSNSRLLSAINILGVANVKGRSQNFDIAGTLAATVDTNHHPRQPAQKIWQPAQYFCRQTNFDAAFDYETLDAWMSETQDQALFEARARQTLERRILLDRVMIGFRGLMRAADSDRAKYPQLEDVNVGWLQQIREQAPQACTESIRVGEGQRFHSLHRLVRHAVNTLLAPAWRDDPQLVALVGADLLPDAVCESNEPGDDLVFHKQRLGGLQAATAAFFPGDSILITRLDNLSLYFNQNAVRYRYQEDPAINSVLFYHSSEDAYVVENLAACALIEDVEIVD
ncbi:P2 family phage major capsid protein [Chromobacterium violaceum]|uniref:Probable major capsid protein of prophage P2 n=1 Tax=Chromobacterium violaceum (strain ATCC 12472 / DSM 30191 / JCM 1249 / CCUG 213 / NBRC 12614 / NCIMB 9131 / NCTC 9757 / MK) TaxID=243365 RepID=Q7P0C1_CHRVO|nr:P2 family phage major capsid protein [Chromobacterium violaceum]AAQ58322.1 probable major capsid protein of prophage P2 [Chromobacterium violaceum ATCC 12472]MBA8733999.1 P2 family phage major capsid protein [Chromobacterium violaceum]SUX40096.1 phage major capsid protein, P2 family [Chromobacterium violaceum]